MVTVAGPPCGAVATMCDGERSPGSGTSHLAPARLIRSGGTGPAAELHFLGSRSVPVPDDAKAPPAGTSDAKGSRLMPDPSGDSGSSIDNRHLLLVGAGPGLGMAAG